MSAPGDDDHGGRSSEPDPRRPALIGLALILALVAGAYLLITALQRNAALEDCLMSGRRNCAQIDMPSR